MGTTSRSFATNQTHEPNGPSQPRLTQQRVELSVGHDGVLATTWNVLYGCDPAGTHCRTPRARWKRPEGMPARRPRACADAQPLSSRTTLRARGPTGSGASGWSRRRRAQFAAVSLRQLRFGIRPRSPGRRSLSTCGWWAARSSAPGPWRCATSRDDRSTTDGRGWSTCRMATVSAERVCGGLHRVQAHRSAPLRSPRPRAHERRSVLARTVGEVV